MFSTRIAGGRRTIVSSFLNVIGIAMAFVALYAIMIQVGYDLNYNKRIKDSDRVFAVGIRSFYDKSSYSSYLSRPYWEDVINNLSCVESGGLIAYYGSTAMFAGSEGGSGVKMAVASMSAGAMTTIGMEAVAGSLDDLVTQQDVALALSQAELLGVTAGDAVYVKNDGELQQMRVAAVFMDFPKGTFLEDMKGISNIGDANIDNYSEWSFPYYVKLHSAADKEEFESQAFDRICRLMAGNGEPSEEIIQSVRDWDLRLFALRRINFQQNFDSVNSARSSGAKTATMLTIALLVLLIAFINFVNFLFALIPVRLKSLNTRKILGASRTHLVLSAMSGAALLVVCAFILSIIIILPLSGTSFASLISGGLRLQDHILVLVSEFAIAVALSILSSLYPTLYMTSFTPALALKGNFGATSKGKVFRYALIGLQFVVSISLIICSTFVSMQRDYMMNYDMGFDKEQLLTTHTSTAASKAHAACGDMLLSHPQIKAVTWADGDIVSYNRMGWGRSFNGEPINFKCYPVNWDFLRVMGIEIVEGRDFSEADNLSDGVFIFNEAAKEKFGITLEDRIDGHLGESEIAGFCKNFNFTSLASPVGPMALYVWGKEGSSWRSNSTLYVRTVENADVDAVIRHIRSTVTGIDPNLSEGDIDVAFFDDKLGAQYKNEKDNATIVISFAILAIIISLMGVFCLVMFESEHRRKEIGVRRVNGASVQDILVMLNMKFMRIVFVCFAIAAPLSWYCVDRYLQSFAYRMPVYWWVFVIALLIVLAVTVAVVTARSYSAVTENPCNTLKRE